MKKNTSKVNLVFSVPTSVELVLNKSTGEITVKSAKLLKEYILSELDIRKDHPGELIKYRRYIGFIEDYKIYQKL